MNSSWPLVKFVDSPSITAAVRFDCNFDSPVEVRKVTAFDPGVPALTGDPDGVGQAFGLRSPSVTVLLKGSKSVAMAALSALSKEQLRPRNWVMYQPSALQQPVWFRTYRPGFQSLNLDRVAVNRVSGAAGAGIADTWELVVPLAADPFVYGSRVTIPTATITQAPSGTNAMRLVLPPIKGDAPTNLRVQITPGGTNLTAATYGCQWLLACVSGPTAAIADPVINIGNSDGLTPGVGVGSPVTDATYFNSDYRDFTSGPEAPVLVERLSGPLAVTPPQGRYKVQLRCEAYAGIDTIVPYVFAFGIYEAVGAPVTILPSVTLPVGGGLGFPAETFTGWVDLGEVNLPAGVGQLPADVAVGTLEPVVSVQITTADGSAGTVRVDALKLIPIDARNLTARVLKATFLVNDPPVSGASAVFSGTFDGDDETYWTTSTISGVTAVIPGSPVLEGAFPIADPAAEENLLVLMATNDGLGATVPKITSLGAQCAVDISYHPRYLYVGDGT